MPKPTVFLVSAAAKYLLREKRFLLAAVGVFAVFTMFTSPLFSMTIFPRGELIQVVDDSYYLIRQASAQEESTSTPTSFTPFSLEQDQDEVQQGDVTTEGNATVQGNATVGPSCPPGTVLIEGNATVGPSCQPATEEGFAQELDLETEVEDLGLPTIDGEAIYCWYAGVRYSPGSVADMPPGSGNLYECQLTGQWEQAGP